MWDGGIYVCNTLNEILYSCQNKSDNPNLTAVIMFLKLFNQVTVYRIGAGGVGEDAILQCTYSKVALIDCMHP